MNSVQTFEHNPVNFIAGDFPIKTDVGEIKSNAKIRKHAPIIQGDNGIEELTVTPGNGTNDDTVDLDNLIGIAADEPNGDDVVYYITGEFYAESLILPDGITAETLKPAFRKLAIILR